MSYENADMFSRSVLIESWRKRPFWGDQCDGRLQLLFCISLGTTGVWGENDCLLFTFDKEMNILNECCLTHCILHHHYLVNTVSALSAFRTARYREVSFYHELIWDFNKGFLTESFSMMFYLKDFVLYFYDNLRCLWSLYLY